MPEFLGAGARHWGFMLRGLRELEGALKEAGIAFFMLKVAGNDGVRVHISAETLAFVTFKNPVRGIDLGCQMTLNYVTIGQPVRNAPSIGVRLRRRAARDRLLSPQAGQAVAVAGAGTGSFWLVCSSAYTL